jgi:hypothetical protein
MSSFIYDEIFLKSDSSEKIIEKVKNGEIEEILNNLCFVNETNSIVLNYLYFKYIATKETYKYIMDFIINVIDKCLIHKSSFSVFVNMKGMKLIDIDKHRHFIQNMSTLLKDRYPNKLEKCFIHNAPIIFTQLYSVICLFIDKETQTKIVLVKN